MTFVLNRRVTSLILLAMASLKFLLLWCLISSQVADGAERDACHTEISFLQAEIRMTPLTQTDPERSPNSRGFLNLLGRSFFSEDPQNSANFWIKYSTSVERKDDDLHHGTTVGLHESLENDAVVVKRSDGMPAEKLYFLKVPDWTSPENLSMTDFIQGAKASWQSVMDGFQIYSPWSDYHDGHLYETINWKQLENDWYKIQLYDIKAVARAYIPNTTWTMEWRAAHELPNLSNKKYEEYIMTADPDKCRNNSDDETPSRTFWKSTFAVLNASSAKDFALDVLNGTEIPNPYPWPPVPGCIAVSWVVLPQDNAPDFQLHFVEDFVYDTVLHSIPEFIQYQRDFLKTGRKCINSFMMNNLILEADSLDPYIRTLEERLVPYFVFEIAQDRYALLFSFPGNEGVTLQLQSPHLTNVEAKPLEFC